MGRELRKNWFQYLSMLLITVLAVTLFLGFLSNSLTLRKRADLYLEESDLADLIVQTTSFDGQDRGEDGYLTNLGASALGYRVYSDGSFTVEGGSPETAEIFISDLEINKPYITDGEAGALLDLRVAELRGYKIGDRVTVELSSFKTALSAFGLDETFEFTVTGFMHSVERVNIYSSSPVFVTPELFRAALAEKLSALYPEGYLNSEAWAAQAEAIYPRFENQALIQCGDIAALKAAIEDEFAAKENNNLIFVYDRDTMEAVVTIDSEVDQSLNMLYVFPVIFFLVALLVIMSTVSRLVLRERTNIGTFKALGIANRRIVFHYAFMGTVVTLLGCIIGAILGPLIVPTVMGIKYTLMFSMPLLSGTVFSIPWTLLTVVFVCLCAMLIGVWASRSVIRENPAECMRPKQISYHPHVKRGTGKASAMGTHALLSVRMALRNVRINWGRSLLTVIGILGCSALLLTSFGIGDTLTASVENDFGGLFHYDVASPYTSAQRDAVYGQLDEWLQDGTIATYESVSSYIVTVRGETNKAVSFWVIAENSVMTDVPSGAMSASTAEELGLRVGDEVTFTIGSLQATCTVEHIVQTSAWNGFFTTENPFGDGAYSSGNVWVQTENGDTVRDALNEINGTYTAKTMADRIGEIEDLISSTNTMKYTLMVFAILLSVVVLYNLSLLNLKERTRDMATLKVLGYTHFQIALSLIVEIMLLTVIGTGLGCAFGFPLLYLVMKINEISIMSFVITLKAVSYLYAVALSVGTAIVINLFFGSLISKIDMTESLKSVE